MRSVDQSSGPEAVQNHWPIIYLFRRIGVIRRFVGLIGVELMTPRRLMLIWIVMIATAMPCFAQALDESAGAKNARAEPCQRVLCRPATTVRLLLRDGMIMEVPFEDESPIVLPNG